MTWRSHQEVGDDGSAEVGVARALTALLIIGLVMIAGGGRADTADLLELGSYVGPAG